MALSFEESKRLAANQQAATMSLRSAAPVAYAASEYFTRDNNYAWFSECIDDKMSYIDENKNIIVNESQVNISQEINSQFVPFEMKRCYDGFDLMNMSISIHYDRSDGTHGASKPVNVEYSNNNIRFVWRIDDQATCIAGKLTFEIHADGTIFDSSGKGYPYRWKSRSTDKFNVLKSLCHDGCDETIVITDDWVQEVVESVAAKVTDKIVDAQISDQVAAAENAAEQAQTSADNAAFAAETAVNNALVNYNTKDEITTTLDEYYDKTESDATFASKADFENLQASVQDLPNTLATDYYTKIVSDEKFASKTDFETLQSSVQDLPTTLAEDYYTKDVSDITFASKEEFETLQASVQDLPTTLAEDYYTKEASDATFAAEAEVEPLKTAVSKNTASIADLTTNSAAISNKITSLEDAVGALGEQTGYEYYATYGTAILEANGEEAENVFTLYEVDGTNESVKSQFVITGGGGSSAAATSLKVERITTSPLTITTTDKAIIEFNCTSTDADGETVDCSYTWKLGGMIISSGSLAQGFNSFDMTEHVSVGTQKFTLTVTDEGGSMIVKTWTVQMVDVRIESSFNDQVTYTAGSSVNFTYTPYGAVSKTVHFILDGKELEPVVTTTSGLMQSYTLPAQEHGAHLLECYITASINGVEVKTDHIFKDIIWYDETSHIPVIGCVYRYDHYGKVAAKQYSATAITYVVYDPSTATPTVGRVVDENTIGTQVMDSNVDIWSYKSAEIGERQLAITCGETSVQIVVDVAELGIAIEPVTANLAFDFNPVGYSNTSDTRLWVDSTNSAVTLSVSDDFDWVNGGYQLDDAGDQYFCVKAGTTATINYNLFGASYDPKATGKEFKCVFKTTNVKKRSGTFLSCVESDTQVGIEMKVENAYIRASDKELFVPYCEDEIIEFEYNINKMEEIPLLMSYEDGVANRPLIYTTDSSFMQLEPQPITIGSPDCDVHIYRMKAYDMGLTDKEILANFIADARNADEMIARYERNQIYDENNALTPEFLAEKCPDLRVIIIEAPWFTNDKDEKIKNTIVRQIYKGGDPVYDNWVCTNARHSGQGTSSNKYGYAGRNIRLIMNDDESLFTFNGTDEDGNPLTGKTVTINPDSVPNAFFNIKVNIASSENQNNAQFANRYNEFNPVVRPAKVADPRVKDCMEFVNCVVFIKEIDTVQDANGNYTNHREFNDTNVHFYAIGNIGDDKKTDATRMNDANDPKECIVEITDFDVPMSEFPTGTNARYISPEEWVAGNTAYDNLHSEYTYEDGKFKAFGSESYEFRYEMNGITDEQREVNINAWYDFYEFVVTSTDEEFVEYLEDYFILDSALYYYLFTERYLMVDNRAKNSFWHRGKVYITEEEAVAMGDKSNNYIIDNDKAAINEGYRYDLCFGYDFDTALGIDNTGKLVLTYGMEDVDKDASGAYVFRAAESNFFCRVRDLFPSQMKAMFHNRENAGAWKSTSLISQWDDAQRQFPEELWRLDVERKYIRTYRGVSVDNSKAGVANDMFLEPMLNGRKRYQRRQFERNNELYFATKYVSTFAQADFIRMRFNNPTNPIVKQDYTLYLTPYTDMYISAEFGNTGAITFRAKAGVEYPVKRATASDTADIVLIYGASFIQAIGDLSKCYLGDNDFSMATRLQSLIIGSDVDGYENTFMAKLSVGNNKLLEYLDIRNITGFTKAEGQKDPVINLSNCNNLVELRAEGSTATGVIFANGGKLERAYLPAVSSLTMKNLQYVDAIDIESYDALQQLTVENTPAVNSYDIVNGSAKLNTVRLVGIDWNEDYDIQDTSILDRLYAMRGIDANGYTMSESVVTGDFHAAVVKEKSLAMYNAMWPDLDITYDDGGLVLQFTVTFKNEDGTVLDVQYVDKGSVAVDPTTRADNPIATPTKASTVSTDYIFNGWDSTFVQVFADQVITATYVGTTRQYTVKYVSNGNVLQQTTADYGSSVMYTGDIPVDTSLEGAYTYKLFSGWDKSGYVSGDKTIDAVYDICTYSAGYFDGKDISEMRPVEIYAMIKLGLENTYVESQDSIAVSFGNDLQYSDIEEEVIIDTPTVFNGTNYLDTGKALLSEDREFVLAIDYTMSGSSDNNAVLAQCYSYYDGSGFRLWNNSGAKLGWGSSSKTVSNVSTREMLVIRHVKGENGVHVYTSNTSGSETSYVSLSGLHSMVHNYTLVFGCKKDDDGTYSNHAIGTIYWSKIWYADLGEDACYHIAAWPHETITMEMCGFRRHYLGDGSGNKCSMTFLANTPLSSVMQLNSAQSTVGGWASASLNTYLNNRLYNVISSEWKQLIKLVRVKSSAGGGSTEISSSNCYITIPAVAEISNITVEPYISELDGAEVIDYFALDDSEVLRDENGNAVTYWTRSPYIHSTTYYQYYIKTDGSPYQFNAVNSSHHVRIMISM